VKEENMAKKLKFPLEIPGKRHSGVDYRTPEKVRDAKDDGGKSQRRSLADRNKATGQTK
jgi:hypothetical protein